MNDMSDIRNNNVNDINKKRPLQSHEQRCYRTALLKIEDLSERKRLVSEIGSYWKYNNVLYHFTGQSHFSKDSL